MSNLEIDLPYLGTKTKVTLFYLSKYDDNNAYKSLDYLQFVRSPAGKKYAQINPEYLQLKESSYNNNLNSFVKKTADLLANDKEFNIIVSPPSKSNYQKPYYDEIKAKYPHAKVITNCFSKISGKSAGNETTFDEFYNDIEYKFDCLKEGTYNSLLIIDDVFATGKTTAAIIKRLSSNNIIFNNYYVICPLYVDINQ